MGDISFTTPAYAKILLHAAKYPHCAVNGIVLSKGSKNKDGSKSQDLNIVDTFPLFHHSHNLAPMAEVALTQIDSVAQNDNHAIAGYYAACENLYDCTVDKCPGQKIAEKIVEFNPSAVFIVLENSRILDSVIPLKVYRYYEGKWKIVDSSKIVLDSPDCIKIVKNMMYIDSQNKIVDFDNYLDDMSQDWTNKGVEKLITRFENTKCEDYYSKHI